MRLAVVVPVFNEAIVIESTLARLAALRARGARVIVVDGGSTDATAPLAKTHADQVLQSERGRAQQMNAGARAAINDGADVLLFVHADSELPDSADRLIDTALRTTGRAWGRFDVRIDGAAPVLRIASAMMNWRSRMTGICTGDQAIFVTRSGVREVVRFCANRIDGRHRVLKARQASVTARGDQHTCGDIRPALAAAWYLAHDHSDVALPSGVFFRRRSAAASTALSRCALGSLSVAQVARGEAAAARRRRAGACARVARPGTAPTTQRRHCSRYAVDPVAIQRHVAGLDCASLHAGRIDD